MAYQNVGTPRFYVNALEFLAETKYTTIHEKYRTLPVNLVSVPFGELPRAYVPSGILNDQSFCAILGHTMAGVNSFYVHHLVCLTK